MIVLFVAAPALVRSILFLPEGTRRKDRSLAKGWNG